MVLPIEMILCTGLSTVLIIICFSRFLLQHVSRAVRAGSHFDISISHKPTYSDVVRC